MQHFTSVLVPNLKGADLVVVPLSASHAHRVANLRKTLIEGGVATASG